MQKRAATFLSLAFLCQHASAQSFNARAWVGTWKLDRGASHFVGTVVGIRHLAHSYRFDLGGTTIEVGDDGKDYTTVPTRTTSFQQLNARQWRRVHKIRGREIDTSIFTLSANAQSFTIHTIATDDNGKEHTSDETVVREGAGNGINGTWRSTSAGIQIPEMFEIAAQSHGLSFSYPSQDLAFSTPLNGSAVAYTGAHAVPSVRAVVSPIAPLQLQRIDLLNGSPYEEEIDILSPDGQQLTAVSWHVATPKEKDQAVYRRYK